MVVVDDGVVLDLVTAGDVDLDRGLATTYHWWWRVSVAVRAARGGALSRHALEATDDEREAMVEDIDAVGAFFRVPDPRDHLDVSAQIAAWHGVNLVAAEALAMCVVNDAGLVVKTHSPPLARGAAALQIPYRVL